MDKIKRGRCRGNPSYSPCFRVHPVFKCNGRMIFHLFQEKSLPGIAMLRYILGMTGLQLLESYNFILDPR